MLPSRAPLEPYYGDRVSTRLVRSCLALMIALFFAGPGVTRADDWSVRRERPAPPSRPSARPGRPPPARTPPRAGLERFLEAALADPSSDLLVEHLVSRRRRADGDLGALRLELEARATIEAKVLLARLDVEEGDLEAARASLTRLVDEAPRSPLAARTLASIERRHGELGRVPALLEVALERSTEPALREALLREKMALHLDRGELGEAEASMKALAATRPRDVSLRLEWARELSRRDRGAEAVRAFEAALAMARGDARVATPIRVELARALLDSGDPEAALREVERAGRAAGGAAFRAALLEIEIAAHRELGSLDALARALSARRDTDSIVARAHILGELGDDEGALAAFQLAIRKRPRDRDLRTALARLYSRMGKLEEVLAEYHRLVRDSAGDPAFVRELALLYDRMGRRPEASRLLDELLRRYPRSAGVARVNAELRERFGDRDALRASLVHWKRADPSDPEPRIALGAELLAAGEREASLREFRGMLELRGDPIESRLSLARVLADHDLLAEAEEAMRPIASRSSEHLEIARVLASILERPRAGETPAERAARSQEAEALWAKVLSHPQGDDESRREARRHIVHLLRLQGRLDAKIEELRLAVERDPEDHRSARLLAEAYLARDPQNPEKALRLLEALARRAGDADVLTHLVRVKRQAGDRVGEAELLERLVTVDTRGSSRHLDRLIQLSLELYRDEDALRFAVEAARRAPHDAQAQRRLGDLHRERRDFDEAIRAYRRAIALDDSHVPTLSALSALELARGNIDESLDLQLRVVRASPDDELVRTAGHAALRLATTQKRLEAVESALTPLAIAYGARPVFRRLLLPVIEAELTMDVDRAALSRRSAKILIETLFEGDAGSKLRALRLIEVLEPESAAKPLMVFASAEGDGNLRAQALVARAALRKAMERSELEPLTRDADRRVRLAAAWATHRGGGEALRLELLRSEDPSVRALASLSFAERPSEAAAALLLSRFRDDVNADVRTAAALAIGRLGGAARLSEVAKVARVAPTRERRAALLALAGSTAPEAREALAAAFFDETASVRETAQAAIRAEAFPRVAMTLEGQPRVPELIEQFFEPEWALRPELLDLAPALGAAARAMLGGPVERKLATLRVLDGRESLDEPTAAWLARELAEDVTGLMNDADARVRRQAASFLVTLSDELASAALARALADSDEVARTALDRFGASLDEEGRELTESAALDAGRWSLRRSAVALLGRDQPSASRVALERALEDDTHAIVRAEAAKALAGVPEARRALERASSADVSRAVRLAAREALESTID
jgi:cellulose synthase operon protein C